MLDAIEFGKSMGGIVNEAIAPLQKTIQQLRERIASLEARELLRGEPGLKDDPGKDAPKITKEEIGESVARYLRDNPPPRGESVKGDPGEPGKRGEDAAPISDEQITRAVKLHLFENPPARGEPGIKGDRGDPGTKGNDAEPISDEQIALAVEQHLRANPVPQGAKGDPGAPGKKGDPGEDAEPVSLREVVSELLKSDELHSLVELRTKEAVAAIPPPKDGLPGKDAPAITQEQIGESVTRYLRQNPPPRGEPGVKGDPGVDGIGMAGAMIDRDGTLIVTTTKGDAVRLGQVVGKDGEDGLGFDDMDAKYNGERGVTLTFARGDSVKEFTFRLPVVMDRGYWREGFKAEQGDAVTHGGTLWIALRDNAAKPCLENKDDWRIGARKGRDGRNGKNGVDAPSAVKLGARDGA
jgi:hypothetical protein